ncbi:MAG: porin [Polaromonas sp.]|uniref:porin n=1 Tax=Polaromonas sp. TaxID=1869339 RepID=UPI002734196A|nr:porin [Polaromonas sp.]MDP3797418.1 porin [Polaromonas sp.]
MKNFKPRSTVAHVFGTAILLAVPGIALADFKLTSGANEFTISGNINAQLDYISTSGASVPANQPASRTRLNQNASELRFSGIRDLGNGLQGFTTIGSEVQSFSGAQASNLNTFAFRNTGVGVRGTFGEVAAGRWDMHYHFNGLAGIDTSYITGPLAWSSQSLWGFVNSSELLGNRFGNTIRYASPTIGNLTFHAIASRGDGGVVSAPTSGIANAKDVSINLAAVYKTALSSGSCRCIGVMTLS